MKIVKKILIGTGIFFVIAIILSFLFGVEETTTTETQTEEIVFQTIKKEDNSINKGETKVETEGINGEKTITYEIVKRNNEEISREKIKEEITKQAVDKIVLVGTYVVPTNTTNSAVQATQNSSTSKPGSTPSKNNSTKTNTGSAEDSSLPLKATCEDGTIQYQDTPSLPNYRGMCSGHGGIKIRHGRVP
jgi:hypothetical protein